MSDDVLYFKAPDATWKETHAPTKVMSNDSKKQYSGQNKISSKNEWTATENSGITELISLHNSKNPQGREGGTHLSLPSPV